MRKFLARWRAWRRALALILEQSKRARVRIEWVLEVDVNPNDDSALSELRAYLPGWHVRRTAKPRCD